MTDIAVPWETLLLLVLLFVALPLAAGVLVKVPVMLSLVTFANRTRAGFA